MRCVGIQRSHTIPTLPNMTRLSNFAARTGLFVGFRGPEVACAVVARQVCVRVCKLPRPQNARHLHWRHSLECMKSIIPLAQIPVIFDMRLGEKADLLAFSDLFQEFVDFVFLYVDASLLLLLLRLALVDRDLGMIDESTRLKVISKRLSLRSKSLMVLC